MSPKAAVWQGGSYSSPESRVVAAASTTTPTTVIVAALIAGAAVIAAAFFRPGTSDDADGAVSVAVRERRSATRRIRLPRWADRR
ncbi:hypothetical protein DFR68_102209 [Nocardia mexicana]|uniref:Uncharacterized protein n=2 Tax=Nocardia mexicana TaxID=279262 RepID=A0A370HAX7_9NOCA|nr:hypothetical protein DFR68_102209 [Nocardia mexicana]